MVTSARGFEVLIGGVALGAVLWGASTACRTGTSTTAMNTGCQVDSTVLTCIGVTITITADGPFTFNFRDQPYSGAGNVSFTFVDLTPGVYDMTGRMSTPNVAFSFTGRTSSIIGGVEQTSLQSLSGPFLATPTRCAVFYRTTAAAPPPQDFHFQFTVGTVPPTC
jgi:hypothetical protein